MFSHNRHVGGSCRGWCAGLAVVAVIAALLTSASTASAAAPATSPVSADCSGSVTPEVLVQFDTIHYTGTPAVAGVQVGPMFCPVPGGQAVQVVVLKRASLVELADYGYSTSQFTDLDSYLHSLPRDDLVIVTHPGDQAALPSDMLPELDKSLSAIGGTVGSQWAFGSTSDGSAGCWSGDTGDCFLSGAVWHRAGLSGSSFSIIGIPGMPAGQAWRETAAQNHTADGRITGYLTPGTLSTGGTGQYTVVNGPDPYVTVDTCTEDGCAVQVGNKTYPATAGASGLHVVILDRTTLAPITNRTVTTTGAFNGLFNDPTLWPFPSVGHFIDSIPYSINDQELVIIQSIDGGKLSGNLGSIGPALKSVDQLGGTVEYLADAVTQGCPYALVGAASDLPWHATSAESSTAMVKPGVDCSQGGTDGLPTGHVYGVLQRDRDGLYTPAAADATGETNVALYSIIYQPATAWPMAGDPGLGYVAVQLGFCPNGLQGCRYADVRSEYTNDNVDFDGEADTLAKLDCTQGPDVCGPDFPALRDQLVKEFRWIQPVRNFTTNLIKPFSEESGSQAFDVKQVTDLVKQSVSPPGNATVTARWQQIFATVMSTASAVAKKANQGAAAAAFGLLGAAATMGNQVMQTTSGGSADDVTTAADNLAAQLANQQKATYEWINSLHDILLSDYGKLSAVGTMAKQWDWTGTETNQLITALDGNARAAAYSALLPVAWQTYNLKAITTYTNNTPIPNPSNPDDVTQFGCSEYHSGVAPDYIPYVLQALPFVHALPQNQFHALTTINVTSGVPSSRVWTFATVSGFANNDRAAANIPTTDLTNDIYGPDSTDSDGAYQYEASWWRSTYNPPSHVLCSQPTEPEDHLSKPYSTAYAAPSIPAPLP